MAGQAGKKEVTKDVKATENLKILLLMQITDRSKPNTQRKLTSWYYKCGFSIS